MTAGAGRDLRLKYTGGTTPEAIAGARSDQIALNKSGIDITDKDDNGIRTMLDAIAVKSATITCSGVQKGTRMIDLFQDNTTNLHSFDIELVGIGTYSGTWMITSLELGGEDGENARTFSATLESSGDITWAAT